MKLTVEWLNKKQACYGGIEWFKNCGETNHKKVLEKLISEEKYDWANWLIVRCMTYKQYVSCAVYAAEQVIDIYEKKYPDDVRPRQAINAAKRCIKNPSSKNKARAAEAAWAAMQLKILQYGMKTITGGK